MSMRSSKQYTTRLQAHLFSRSLIARSFSPGGDRADLTQKAFKGRDAELSRVAHELATANEAHKTEAGQYIKAAVFGGLDGIITTFAVVASVTGANLATGVVIIMVRKSSGCERARATHPDCNSRRDWDACYSVRHA